MIKMNSGATALVMVLERPEGKRVQTAKDCMSGGYSVWACPPQKKYKLPSPAKNVP
jgi:hypothetical protein